MSSPLMWRLSGTLLLLWILLFTILGCGSVEPQQASDEQSEVRRTLPRKTTNQAAVLNLKTGRADTSAIISKIDNPESEGWTTEVLHEAVKQQLKHVGKLISVQKSKTSLSSLLTDDFSCSPLRPIEFTKDFEDRTIQVVTGVFPNDSETGSKENGFRGADGLRRAARELLSEHPSTSGVRVAFKVVGVEPRDDSLVTRELVSVFGTTKDTGFEQHAEWVSEWKLPATKSQLPRLRRIEVESFHEAQVRRPNGTLFRDCTKAVFAQNESYRRQLAYGSGHWIRHVDVLLQPSYTGHHGIAIGDVNDDGLEDVYVCQTGGLPNRLLIQQPDGTVTDISHQAGVDWCDITTSALFLDLDNDGDQDLVIATEKALLLMANDGQGGFSLRGELPEAERMDAMAAADFDSDGLLDLFLCRYSPDADTRNPLPAPESLLDAANGGRNILFKNAGNWVFEDVTGATGLDQNNHRFSFAASWDDYDNDGDLDLYVANDYGSNNLFRNDDGRFVDVARSIGADDRNFGMSVAWGDINRDGFMDLYVSNMFSSAGNRVIPQSKFKPGISNEQRSALQRLARGNTLLQNTGEGGFRDISQAAGVTMGRWAWGSRFLDINNDGWEDLFVANGYITQQDSGDL